jgi:hypothetical protein
VTVTKKTTHVQDALDLLPEQMRSGEAYTAPAVITITIPEDLPLGPILYLKDSDELTLLPPISTSRAVITSAEFASGQDAMAAYPDAEDYLLVDTTGDDFRAWPNWIVSGVNGTAERPRTIRYFSVADDYLHPIHRENEVFVPSIQFVNSGYWMVSGVSWEGESDGDNDVRDGSHHIVWDQCYMRNSSRKYAWRIRSGEGSVIQRCVALDPVWTGPGGRWSDTIAANISPIDGEITDTKVIDCEWRNYGDGVQPSANGADGFIEVDYHLEGNDIYIDEFAHFDPADYPDDPLIAALPDGYEYAFTENAIDLKSGSDSTQSIVRNNRMWGFRKNGKSSEGDALEIHRHARNVLFDGNFISDCPFGYFETQWDSPTSLETPRDMVFTNNQFRDITTAHSPKDGAGSAYRANNNHDCDGNWYALCSYVIYVFSTQRAGGPDFDGETRVGTDVLHPFSVSNPWIEADNTNTPSPSIGFQRYQRRRFTGPEIATGAKLLASGEDDQQPIPGFTIEELAGTVTVTSTATAPGSSISGTTYNWGDGTTNSLTSHDYVANGIYSIRQTVTAANGLTSTVMRSIWITSLTGPQDPRFRSYGTPAEGTTAITPGVAADIVEGDLLWVVCETQGTAPPSLSAGLEQGFTLAFQIDSTLVAGSCLTIWERFAPAGAVTAPTIADSGDHQFAVMVRFDRVDDADPYNVSDSSLYTGSTDPAVTFPTVTTDADRCLVVNIGTTAFDSATGQFSGWANAGLSSVTEQFNQNATAGNGGGIGICTGVKALQGFVGATTATLANASRQIRLTVALNGATL